MESHGALAGCLAASSHTGKWRASAAAVAMDIHPQSLHSPEQVGHQRANTAANRTWT